MTNSFPTFDDIIKTAERIEPYIHRTPVFASTKINEMIGAKIFFKCENFQKAGAFKYRGACNAILSLSDKEARRGVVTHSSGNHAASVALAASMRNIKAYIVMPENAPEIKKKAVKNYGGEIVFCKHNMKSRIEHANKVIEKTGAVLIHPFDDYRIITGQATAALELLTTHPDLDIMLAPVSGGGLMSGTALSSKYHSRSIKVYGAEPSGADDAFQSFKAGKIIPLVEANTIADGLRASIGELTFPIIKKFTDDIITVEENEIIKAMRTIWEYMKIIIEPSSAVPVAVLLEKKIKMKGKKIGVILSGGNVDLDILPWNN